ncbi:MAG: hypothetical protein MUF19_03900 [Candidatus Pacebacteria bacterium]|nr:hypothetical protein [Candidatus Paceibacterota bacterium]
MEIVITNLVLALVLYFVVTNQHRYFCQEYDVYSQSTCLRRVLILLESSISVRAVLILWAIVFAVSAGIFYARWHLEEMSQIEKDLPD